MIYVFDYDGVIVDSFETVYEIVTKDLKEFGIPKLTKKEFKELYDTNFFEAVAKKGFPLERVQEFLNELQKQLILREKNIKIFTGIADVMNQIKLPIIIVTSNISAVVKSYLDHNKIPYTDVIGSEQETSKVKKIEKIKQRYHQTEVLFIGDTVGDIIEGKKAGVKTAAVTWGYHAKDKLIAAKPDYVIDNPQKLVDFQQKAL